MTNEKQPDPKTPHPGFNVVWNEGSTLAIVYCDGLGKIGDLRVDMHTGDPVLLAKSTRHKQSRAFSRMDVQIACEWLKLRASAPAEFTPATFKRGRR
jgi:hypothetical protein